MPSSPHDPAPPDVFLALGGSRREAAVQVAELLRARGWQVRLDADLTDEDWTTGLTAWIKAARAIIVLLPADGANAHWLRHELPLIDELKVTGVSVQTFAERAPSKPSEALPYTTAWNWRPWDPNNPARTADAAHDVLLKRLGPPAAAAPPTRPELPNTVQAHKAALNRELKEARERQRQAARKGDDLTPHKQDILRIRRALNEGLTLAPDMVLDHYELDEKIGSGGFGTVWRAWDKEAHRTVALKVMHPNRAEDRSRLDRFFRGARQMEQLRHPYVVRVLQRHGEDRGLHYYVMELVQRGDLHAAVTRGEIGTADALERVLEAGEALAYAHTKEVVHRDVKPHNLLIGDDGRVRITDFDLVKAADTTGATKTGTLGTWLYVAPEAMEHVDQEVDGKADVYGLAMTAAFCLQRSDPGKSAMFQREKWLRSLPTGQAVREAVARGLKLEPAERPTMPEFIQRLRDAVQHDATTATAPRPSPTPAASLTPRAPAPTPPARTTPAAAAPPPAGQRQPGERMQFELPGGVLLPMAYIPAGTFWMGSPEGVGEDRERPRHQVTLTRPYWMGVTPVTQAQWAAVARTTTDLNPDPSYHKGPDRPVDRVNWDDARAWCNALSRSLKLSLAYPHLSQSASIDWLRGFRLPTEAEWERACRAGTDTAWSFGDDPARFTEHAWYDQNSHGQTQPVGKKRPNPWGLHDLHGNVWEWCWDGWGRAYTAKPVTDPAHPPNERGYRLLRGGAFHGSADWCRSAYRDDGRSWSAVGRGFRVVLPAPARDP